MKKDESSSLFKEMKMKTSYVKVKKKAIDGEGGEKWRMIIYKELRTSEKIWELW